MKESNKFKIWVKKNHLLRDFFISIAGGVTAIVIADIHGISSLPVNVISGIIYFFVIAYLLYHDETKNMTSKNGYQTNDATKNMTIAHYGNIIGTLDDQIYNIKTPLLEGILIAVAINIFVASSYSTDAFVFAPLALSNPIYLVSVGILLFFFISKSLAAIPVLAKRRVWKRFRKNEPLEAKLFDWMGYYIYKYLFCGGNTSIVSWEKEYEEYDFTKLGKKWKF